MFALCLLAAMRCHGHAQPGALPRRWVVACPALPVWVRGVGLSGGEKRTQTHRGVRRQAGSEAGSGAGDGRFLGGNQRCQTADTDSSPRPKDRFQGARTSYRGKRGGHNWRRHRRRDGHTEQLQPGIEKGTQASTDPASSRGRVRVTRVILEK